MRDDEHGRSIGPRRAARHEPNRHAGEVEAALLPVPQHVAHAREQRAPYGIREGLFHGDAERRTVAPFRSPRIVHGLQYEAGADDEREDRNRHGYPQWAPCSDGRRGRILQYRRVIRVARIA